MRSVTVESLAELLSALSESTLTKNARTLSEAPRQTGPGEGQQRAGAVSIRALEGRRWRGVSDAASYGF
jgi:hypothetical protein